MSPVQLRDGIAQHRPVAARSGFPPELKAAVVQFARRQRAVGQTWRVIADSLGLSTKALRDWCAPEKAATMLAVQLRPDEISLRNHNSVALVTPRGFRVEGLDLAELAQLLERLG